MPSRHSPAPCPYDNIVGQQDYFGPRNVSSIPTRNPYNILARSKTATPSRHNSIPRKPLPYRRQKNASSETILRHNNVLEPAPNEAATSSTPPSPAEVERVQVNDTVDNGGLLNTLPIPTPSQQPNHFLGIVVRLTDPGGSHKRKALVISSPLVLMNQVLILPRFCQSLRAFVHGEQTKTLYRSLPACLGSRARMISWSPLLLKAAPPT